MRKTRYPPNTDLIKKNIQLTVSLDEGAVIRKTCQLTHLDLSQLMYIAIIHFIQCPDVRKIINMPQIDTT